MPGIGDAVDESDYRYGFNGNEKYDEVKGDGVQYDYGFRIYDARIAKFLSVDPLTKQYPMLTPYQFASNRPIDGIDLEGLEYFPSTINKETGERQLIIKLKVSFAQKDKSSIEYREKLVKNLSTLISKSLSGPLPRGGSLIVKPELTIVNESDLKSSDYRIQFVNTSDINNKGGRTYSPKLSKVSSYFELLAINEQETIEGAEYTALHELGHMLGLRHTFPNLSETDPTGIEWPSPDGFLQDVSWDVRLLWVQANKGDKVAMEKYSNLVMNYPEGTLNVPEGAGRKEDATQITVGERTKLWNSAVRDQHKRLGIN